MLPLTYHLTVRFNYLPSLFVIHSSILDKIHKSEYKGFIIFMESPDTKKLQTLIENISITVPLLGINTFCCHVL